MNLEYQYFSDYFPIHKFTYNGRAKNFHNTVSLNCTNDNNRNMLNGSNARIS